MHSRKQQPLLKENQINVGLKLALECIENPNPYNKRLFNEFLNVVHIE